MKPSLAAMLLLLGASGAAAAGAEVTAGDPLARWVVVDGIRVRYLEEGSAASPGPNVLMVHGWAGSAEDFRPLFSLLPPGAHLVALDLPGAGQSDKPDLPYDLPFFLSFLRDFCAALGLERFILVGHSMGGQMALHFTARWPQLVEKLVLIAPYGLKGEEGIWLPLAGWGGFVDLGFRLNNRLFITWTIRLNVLYHASDAVVREAVDSSARSMLGPEAARAMARVTHTIIGHHYVEDILPSVTQETLLIWGDHDKVLAPSWSTIFLKGIPHARLCMVKDSGHMPMIEHPQETADLLAPFLQD